MANMPVNCKAFGSAVKMTGFTFTLICLLSIELISANPSCIPRDFGYVGTVCVCNSTYCDNAEPLPSISDKEYVLYVSSLEGLRFNLTKNQFDENQNVGNVHLVLNSSKVYQKILGFGAAFTDSVGINLVSLSEGAQDLLLQSYFSPKGNSYTLGRVPIAGSDFSDHPYTYADTEDPLLQNFSLSYEDHVYKIPFIQKAIMLSDSKLQLLAAAWTAPPWMKTNGNYTGVGSLKQEYYALWSDYHIRFLEEYDKEGLSFWTISSGNEPLNGDVPLFPFNCMGWTPLNQRIWISQHMGPALQNSKFNKTSILAYDDQRIELPWWLKTLFEDDEISQYVEGVGVHWYWDKVAPLSLLDQAHEAHPNKYILATEASYTKKAKDTNVVRLGSWERGEGYAESVIDDLNHYVAGWVDWNFALDSEGGPNWAANEVDCAIIVNKTSDEFYKQPMYYALGHVSKFVPPGSFKIELTGDGEIIKSVAFRTPTDQLVIMLLNKQSVEETITISGLTTPANFNLPPRSIVTFISNID